MLAKYQALGLSSDKLAIDKYLDFTVLYKSMRFEDYLAERMRESSMESQEIGYAGLDLVSHHRKIERGRMVFLPAFLDAVTPVLDRHVEGGPVLEIGSGTGFFYRRIASDALKQRIVGTDINYRSLDEFRRLAPKANLFLTSANRLPFPDGFFDNVIGYSAFDGLLFLKEALEEAKRVLKTRGKLLLFQDLATDLYLTPEERETCENGIKSVERYHERLLKDAAAAGFEIVEGEDFLDGFASEPVADIARRAGTQLPLPEKLEWDRGVYDDFGGIVKVVTDKCAKTEERVRMRYLVARK